MKDRVEEQSVQRFKLWRSSKSSMAILDLFKVFVCLLACSLFSFNIAHLPSTRTHIFPWLPPRPVRWEVRTLSGYPNPWFDSVFQSFCEGICQKGETFMSISYSFPFGFMSLMKWCGFGISLLLSLFLFFNFHSLVLSFQNKGARLIGISSCFWDCFWCLRRKVVPLLGSWSLLLVLNTWKYNTTVLLFVLLSIIGFTFFFFFFLFSVCFDLNLAPFLNF